MLNKQPTPADLAAAHKSLDEIMQHKVGGIAIIYETQESGLPGSAGVMMTAKGKTIGYHISKKAIVAILLATARELGIGKEEVLFQLLQNNEQEVRYSKPEGESENS